MKILILFTLLTSCSIFQSNKKNSSPILVSGSGKDISMNVDELAFHLSRETTLGGGIYEIRAMPLSRAYLERRFQKIASNRGLQEKDYSVAAKWHVERYLKNRTCIDFDYNVTRFEQMKDIDQWKLVLEVDGDQYELEWLKENTIDRTYVTELKTPTHLAKRWHNRAIACAPVELSLWRGFSLKAIAAYVPWPFGNEASMEWIFEAMNPEDEEAIEARKKKNFQKYRGW